MSGGIGTMWGVVILALLGTALAGPLTIIPIWVVILSFCCLGTYMAVEIGRIFRGAGIDSSAANATTGIVLESSAWTQIVGKYTRPLKTVNCGNCGGPNVNQVKCEWCGQVL